jgi:hypothetical protein
MTSLPLSRASEAASFAVPSGFWCSPKALRNSAQFAEAAHVALAPARDAMRHPMFLADDLAAKLVMLAFVFLVDLVAPVLELGETGIVLAQRPAVEPQRAARQFFEETPVMRDQHKRRTRARKFGFEPFDGGQVEMVGRLVEEQDVGFRGERSGKRGAAGFAAGETLRRPFGVEPQFAEQVIGAEGIVERPELGAGISADRVEAGEVRILRQVADGRVLLLDHLAAGRIGQPGGDAQQRRLCPSRCGRPARCGRRHGRKRKCRQKAVRRRRSA